MTVYQRKDVLSVKWLVALIVFLLALGITFTDVYGYTPTHKGGTGNHGSKQNNTSDQQGIRPDVPDSPRNESYPPPTAIPEPTTILLLAGGLGAMYAVRRWRKSDV